MKRESFIRILSLSLLFVISSSSLASNGKGHGNSNGVGHENHGNGNGYGHDDHDDDHYGCTCGNNHSNGNGHENGNGHHDHGNGNGYGHDHDCDDDDDYYTYLETWRVRDLVFPTVIGGYRQNVVVNPQDPTAAVFKVFGYPYARIKVEMTVRSGFMYSWYGDDMKVKKFKYGGSVDSNGYGYLNKWGYLDNIRIGGKALVRARHKDSYYAEDFNIEVSYD